MVLKRGCAMVCVVGDVGFSEGRGNREGWVKDGLGMGARLHMFSIGGSLI